jgi:hypothetical protein
MARSLQGPPYIPHQGSQMKTLYILAVMFAWQHYVVDSNLNREDCGRIIALGVESLTLDEGVVAVPEDASYECQPQEDIPASRETPAIIDYL